MPTNHPTPRAFRRCLPAALVGGFGVAVAMWAVGFVTHLPGVDAPPWIVGVLMLCVQLAGSACCGRITGSLAVFHVGGMAGLVTAIVNSLILGSALADPKEPNALRADAIPLALGYVGFSVIAGAAMALLGRISRRSPGRDEPAEHWLALFAVISMGAALLVVLSGGIVTSKGAGLAVPDWPTSFSANMVLFPLSKMSGGIYYEHAHRLFGSLAGFTVLTLLVFTMLVERRAWAKFLVIAVFLLVVIQGVLGGVRVGSASPTAAAPNSPTIDNELSLPLALAHGVLGQITFAALCATAAMLSTRWRRKTESIDQPAPDSLLVNASWLLIFMLVIQLGLGAVTRHMHQHHALFSHMGFALIAFIGAAIVAFRAIGRHRHEPPLYKLGHVVLYCTILQVLLGFAAFVTVLPYDGTPKSTLGVILSTAHQANGAALLGAAAAMFAWTRRLQPRAQA